MHVRTRWPAAGAIGGFGTALLLSLSACGRDAKPARPQDPQTPGVSAADTSAGGRLAALDTGLRQIEEGLRTARRDRWDPAYVVERVGRDPAALTAWVRDSTAWIPYRGLLRGPVGVLMDRDGNSLDRALLLARLLALAGHEVRLARATLDPGVAADLLPGLVARRQRLASPSILTAPGQTAPVSFTSGGAESQPDGVAGLIAAQERAAWAIHAELDRRAREQSGRLLAMTTPPPPHRDWARRQVAALRALQDHWWVQGRDGDRWVDLDPLPPGDGVRLAAGGATPETLAPDAVPEGLRHRIAVRVIGEELSRGALAEKVVLADTILPADLTGRGLVLQVWPASWPAEVHHDPASPFGLRGIALEQHAWAVALTADGEPLAEGKLTDGEAVEEEGVSPGPLGALGGAMRKLNASRAEGGRSRELTSAWIEYELLAPDAPPRTIRRAIFDLLGPAARARGAPDSLVLDERQRLVRSLALMIRTEILPVTGRMAPQYAAHLMLERLVANRPLLRRLVGDPNADRPPDSALAAGPPPLSSLYALAYARSAWSPVADQMYVDRLGLLTQHRHPAVMGNQLGMRGAFDVAAGEMGVSLAVADGFAARLRQGVFDTNAEGLWWSGVASLNTGEVFGASQGWKAIPAAKRERLADLKLPDDARWRIGQDLAAGFTVVAPEAAIPMDDERYVGWWRIDPATGATRGVSGNGWGQCNAEYSVNVRTVTYAYARGFFFEFGLCQALAQSINGSRTIAAELQKRKLWFWWMPPIRASDPRSVFRDNAKTCLVSAMAAGFLATMPILLMAARAEEALAAARIAAAERDAAARAAAGGEGAGAGRPRGNVVGDGDPLAKTQPDLGKTQPDLGRTQPDLGKTQPDLGETQPGKRPDLGRTQDLGNTQPEMKTNPGGFKPEGGSRPQGPRPTSQADAQAKLKEAIERYKPLQAESSNRTGDWIRENMKAGIEPEGQPGDPDYHPGRPPDPDFNPDYLEELDARAKEANDAAQKALAEVKAAEDNLEWAEKAVRRGEIPFNEPSAPASSGCPPNCSGQSSTSGEQLVSGSASVSGSFYPHSWGP